MRTSHTPGPWHVVAPNGDIAIKIHTPYKTTNQSAVPVCTLIADSREGVNALANAHLIAAAPELLSVLDDLFNGTRMEMTPEMNDRVLAVLRKARGLK